MGRLAFLTLRTSLCSPFRAAKAVCAGRILAGHRGIVFHLLSSACHHAPSQRTAVEGTCWELLEHLEADRGTGRKRDRVLTGFLVSLERWGC